MNDLRMLGRRAYYFSRWNNPSIVREAAGVDYNIVFKSTVKTIDKYTSGIKNKRILDLGCGLFFPQTLLLHSLGAKITGIDFCPVIPSTNITKRLRFFGQVEPMEATFRIFQEIRVTPVYYGELRQLAGFPLTESGLDIRQADICNNDFEDQTFDLIISNAVFEHITNVEKASQEMLRVMKKDAIARVEIHLFPSLTGGHVLPYAPPGSQIVVTAGVPPWDHLRDKKYTATRYNLNKLRERDYKKIFEKYFEIVEWNPEFWEPERFLTAEIKKELPDYSRDELLKRSIVVVLRKEL